MWVLPLLSFVFGPASVSEIYRDIVESFLLRSAAVSGLVQAALSTLLSVLIGVPLGVFLAETSERVSPRIWRLCFGLLGLPWVVPSLLVAVAWTQLIRPWPRGLGLGYRLETVIAANLFFNLPWIALGVSQRLIEFGATERATARTLGAGFIWRFRLLLPRLIAGPLKEGAAQVFFLCSTSYTLVLLLGEGRRSRRSKLGLRLLHAGLWRVPLVPSQRRCFSF